jgi:integrase
MVMELLGHSNISLTLGTYSHILPQLARDTAQKMDSVLGEVV